MKTAMQELILKLPNEFIFDNSIIILEALKKEKEQIINAAKSCNYIGGATDIEAEKYYNQTYNQDRIKISETKRSIEGIGLNNQNK